MEAIFKQQITAGDVIVVEMDMSHLLEEGRRLAELGIGAIVARGGAYEDLKKEITQVPVIKIEMSVSDILFSLARARASYSRIYLILYENIIFDLEMWKDLLNISLTLIPVSYTHLVPPGDPGEYGNRFSNPMDLF